MKQLLIVVLIALTASLTFNFILIERNYKAKQALTVKIEQKEQNERKQAFKIDSIQCKYDSLLIQKEIVRIKNHYKIVEKQKLVEVFKTDSNYTPIIFNPEYQLLACMYDSLYSDKDFTEKMLFIRNEQVQTFANRSDSLNFELNKYKKIAFRLFFKTK